MAKSIDDQFASILSDVKTNANKAVEMVANKVLKDVQKEANTYLKMYYASYKPKRYVRTNYLKNAMLPILKRSKDGSIIRIGVRYDSDKLAGHYTSNSKNHQSGGKWISFLDDDFKFDSGNNGIPEPEWILDNFLHGEHGGYHQDFYSTDILMNDFFENILKRRIDKYVKQAVWKIFTSNL